MPQARVKDAKVVSTFFDGKGARVVEEYTVRGETRKSYTVLWFQQPHGLNTGDIVTASGVASVKMGKEYKTQDGELREPRPELHVNVTDSTQPAPTFDGDVPF